MKTPFQVEDDCGPDGEHCFFSVRDTDGHTVVSTWPGYGIEIANMCAAAPDMLAALKTCICPAGGWTGRPDDIEPTVENCMTHAGCGCDCGAAIRKAEGKQP